MTDEANTWPFPGASKAEIQELPQIKDRLTFLYLEHCSISRDDSSIRADYKTGYILIPSHKMMVFMLGPGTSITHQAICLIAEAGSSIVWCGEEGNKFYSSGKALTESSRLLQRQAEIAVKPKEHMEAVKRMYWLRFPDEDLSNMTLQQLRGKEGSRVRKQYKAFARQYGVPWQGREYDPYNFEVGTTVNKALSYANACLYSLTYAVVSALGLSPGLGFIHSGNRGAFIFDVADLYKAETSIPVSFRLAAEEPPNLYKSVRTEMRNSFSETHLIERMIKDLKFILKGSEPDFESIGSPLVLWDNTRGNTEAGIQYIPRNEDS